MANKENRKFLQDTKFGLQNAPDARSTSSFCFLGKNYHPYRHIFQKKVETYIPEKQGEDSIWLGFGIKVAIFKKEQNQSKNEY